MIAQPVVTELKQRIETFSRKILSDVPLFAGARSGAVTQQQVTEYVYNLRFLISHTQEHLQIAYTTARRLGLSELVRFYAEKIPEELGHERWADDDIGRLTNTKPLPRGHDAHLIREEVLELARFNNKVVASDPFLYVVYMLMAEYVTVLVSPPWLELLEKNCGIPSSHMSILEKHVALDKDHVAEDLEVIGEMLAKAEDPEHVLAIFENWIGLVEAFFRSFCCQGVWRSVECESKTMP